MKNETKGIAPLIIAVVVIVVVAGVGVGAYVVVTRGGGEGGGGGGGGGGLDIGSATSLSFNVTASSYGLTNVTFQAKNIGSSNLMLRIEGTINGSTSGFIVNGVQQKVWSESDGTWTEVPGGYSYLSGVWDPIFQGFRTSLLSVTVDHWESPDGTVTISNISTAELSDSLFQP